MPQTATPRIPQGSDVYLDHVGAYVADRRRAAIQLRRIGFTLTPYARHVQSGEGGQQPSGTGNQCVMFREGYLEILSATGEATPLAALLHRAVERYEGLHLVTFAVADAEARHAALPGRRFKPLPLVRLRRPTPGGGGDELCRFDVVRLPPGTMPEGRVQIITHHTPELVWRPDLLVHANGAEALTGILIAVDDPSEVAIRFSRFVDRQALFVDPDQSEVELQRGRVTLVRENRLKAVLSEGPPQGTPYMAAIAVRCRDLKRLARHLAASRVDFRRDGGRLLIGPEHAVGMTIVFHDAATQPWP